MGERKYPQGVHDDAFNFMIDEIAEGGKLIQHHGGANNILAARAAYVVYCDQYPRSIIQLRSRARIISESKP